MQERWFSSWFVLLRSGDQRNGRLVPDGREVFLTVFENGTGFVWHGGGTQEEHAVKRALIVEMKSCLVTVHEAEGGFGGEIIEGASEAIERIGGLLGGGFIFEEPGFHGQGAAEAPVGSDHILDHAELHAIGGLEAIEGVIYDRLKKDRERTRLKFS